MRVLETISASEILAMPVHEPERLFSGRADALRAEFVALAKIWHPDVNAGSAQSTAVFEHILALHATGERKLKSGTWTPPGALRVFVSPQLHAVFPLGGWWYAARSGSRLQMLPDETFALLPRSMAASQRADIRLDLEAVRAIALNALGDPTGLSLAGRPDLPKPMADYLRLPSAGTAIDDYRAWGQVLTDSFGPRRFVELPVTFSDVYN